MPTNDFLQENDENEDENKGIQYVVLDNKESLTDLTAV